jgi:hypothetical protein
MGDPVDIPGYGKLSIASDAKAPLLVVFGGIDVEGVQSGVYMWKYMDKVKDRFHIFVARSHAVNGTKAFGALTSTLKEKGLTPSSQILYLFSGGYRPGMDLLPGGGAATFSSIFLVDIWMGVTKKSGSVVPDFYKKLADGHASQITYVFTAFGANNEKARDYIAGKVTAIPVQGSSMHAHMSTNTFAVDRLP